jgi:hypothetical protein
VATSTSRCGAAPPARLVVDCPAITSPHLGTGHASRAQQAQPL